MKKDKWVLSTIYIIKTIRWILRLILTHKSSSQFLQRRTNLKSPNTSMNLSKTRQHQAATSVKVKNSIYIKNTKGARAANLSITNPSTSSICAWTIILATLERFWLNIMAWNGNEIRAHIYGSVDYLSCKSNASTNFAQCIFRLMFNIH